MLYDVPYDNYSRWEAYNDEQEEWLNKRPVCDICGHHIQDDYLYNIEGEQICEDCLNNNYREYIED